MIRIRVMSLGYEFGVWVMVRGQDWVLCLVWVCVSVMARFRVWWGLGMGYGIGFGLG